MDRADSVVQYLSSPEAERDVAAQLERARTGQDHSDDRWTICHALYGNAESPWQMAFCMGSDHEGVAREAEPKVTYPTREAVKVYFRLDYPPGACIPDFELTRRYLVTDLGEAVRALRLRAGQIRIPPKYRPPDGVIAEIYVPFADLPAAICRVLLAAYLVSHLEIPVAAVRKEQP